MTLATAPELPPEPTPELRSERARRGFVRSTAREHYRCDLCAIAQGHGTVVRRFSLIRSARPKPDQKVSRGAGTILLCERCWATTAGKRRRRYGIVVGDES